MQKAVAVVGFICCWVSLLGAAAQFADHGLDYVITMIRYDESGVAHSFRWGMFFYLLSLVWQKRFWGVVIFWPLETLAISDKDAKS